MVSAHAGSPSRRRLTSPLDLVVYGGFLKYGPLGYPQILYSPYYRSPQIETPQFLESPIWGFLQPAPPNYPLRYLIYQLIETTIEARLIEVHWGFYKLGSFLWVSLEEEPTMLGSILEPRGFVSSQSTGHKDGLGPDLPWQVYQGLHSPLKSLHRFQVFGAFQKC